MKIRGVLITIWTVEIILTLGCHESVKKNNTGDQPYTDKSEGGTAPFIVDSSVATRRDATAAGQTDDGSRVEKDDAKTNGPVIDASSVDSGDARTASDTFDGAGSDEADVIDADAEMNHTGVECGPRHCRPDQFCCNESCGICVFPNGRCSDVVCLDASAIDAAPFEDLVDDCPDGCMPIYGSPEGRQKYCLDRAAGQFLLGCSCDPLPYVNAGCLYHEATDSLYYSFDTGGLESTPGWSECENEDWRRVDTACAYSHCEYLTGNTCTLEELCSGGLCGVGRPFDQTGCRVPTCQSDSECSADERCTWDDCSSYPFGCRYHIEIEQCACSSVAMCSMSGYCVPKTELEALGYGPDRVACSGRTAPSPYDIAFDFEVGVERECLIGRASRTSNYQGKSSLIIPIIEQLEAGSSLPLELTFLVDDSSFAVDDPQRFEAQCCAIQHALSLGIEYVGSSSNPNAFTVRVSTIDQFIPLVYRRDVIALDIH